MPQQLKVSGPTVILDTGRAEEGHLVRVAEIVLEVFRDGVWRTVARGGFELATTPTGWELRHAGYLVAPPWRAIQRDEVVAENRGPT